MLVKLGSDWYDPALISSIFVGYKEEDDDRIYIQLSDGCKSWQVADDKNTVDAFANIVNEALAPKQSWSEEISEPESA